MKSDTKKLYKKDPKLAIQVAKALGYKIKGATNAIIEDIKKQNSLLQKSLLGSLFKQSVKLESSILTAGDADAIKNDYSKLKKAFSTYSKKLMELKKEQDNLDKITSSLKGNV